MLARLARHFHVDETNIRARLLELRSTAKRTPTATQATNPTSGKGMTPHEIELFEIMVLHPDLARRALAAIDAGAISSESARSVWELFERAARENVELEFEQVLTVAEDASLKSLLVKLIDRAQEKAELAGETAEERLSGLIHDFDERREELSQRAALAALEKRDYDEEEEVRILEKSVEQQRGRQGIPAPTDG
jgi:hypothetical protein